MVTLVQYLFFGGLLGARLGEFLLYQPEILFSDPTRFFHFREGGMSSHGGFLGVCLAIFLFVRNHPGFTYLWILDRMAIVSASIVCLMRLGNLMNSELPGTVTAMPWAFLFPHIEDTPLPRHPVVLYEAIAYGFLWLTSLWIYRKNLRLYPGQWSTWFLCFLVPVRMLLEFFKQSDQSLLFHLSHTQWLSVPLFIAGIIWWMIIRKKEKSGLS